MNAISNSYFCPDPSFGEIKCYSGEGKSAKGKPLADWTVETCKWAHSCVKYKVPLGGWKRGCPILGFEWLLRKEQCTFFDQLEANTYACSCNTDLCNDGPNIKTQNYKFQFMLLILTTVLFHVA